MRHWPLSHFFVHRCKPLDVVVQAEDGTSEKECLGYVEPLPCPHPRRNQDSPPFELLVQTQSVTKPQNDILLIFMLKNCQK